MSASATLTLQGLSATVSPSMTLNDIDLTVGAGETAVVIGPNGAGKTSLLRAICNDLRLDSGSVKLGGREMAAWTLQERAKTLAILPQRSNLEFPFTVTEVVTMGRIPHSTSQRRNEEIVEAALEMVDCNQFAERFYINLSGGEKQRVQLARVAAQIWEDNGRDRCLVLDEPSASLDLAHQAMIVEMVQTFARKGVAILVVLHDLHLASKVADKMIALREGAVAAVGTVESVLSEQLLNDVFGVKAQVLNNDRDGSRVIVT